MVEWNKILPIVAALILGIVVGYFLGTFVYTVSGGRAVSVEQVCGDSVREGSEECDGGTRNCEVSGPGDLVYSGTQSCNSTTCAFNPCVSNTYCGDSIKSSNEQCDGSDLGGVTCEDLGLSGGTLSCDSSCKFDSSGCS